MPPPPDSLVRATARQLQEGVSVGTSRDHRIELVAYELRVRLAIDPHEASTLDDRFTLRGGDPSPSARYSQTKTIRDDLVPGDEFVDLLFTDLVPNLDYWLEVDPGKEGRKHFAFEALPWTQIEAVARR